MPTAYALILIIGLAGCSSTSVPRPCKAAVSKVVTESDGKSYIETTCVGAP